MNEATRLKGVGVCVLGLGILLLPESAQAVDWGVKLEPGMAAPAGQPQARMFGPGFGLSLKGLIGLGRYLDAQAGITYVGLSPRADAPTRQTGGAWGYGGGLRLKRPHDLAGGYSPWLDGDLMYVRTGPLNRFGFSIGAGVSMALDHDRRFWLGPFVRYMQIVQVEKAGANTADAKLFIVGASLELAQRIDAHERRCFNARQWWNARRSRFRSWRSAIGMAMA